METVYFVIGLVFQALPFVVAVTAALLFVFFCFGAYNSPVVVAWVGALLYLLSQLGANSALRIGLSLSLVDFYFALLGLVAAVRVLGRRLPQRDWVARLWLVMAAVWGLLFLIGTVKFKKNAGVEFRSTFYILATVVYLLTFNLQARRTAGIFRALYVTALALVGLAVYRWVSVGLGQYGFWYDYHTPLRVLDSSATLVIAVSLLPGAAMWLGLNERQTGPMFLAPALLLAVIALGHRTVWVSTLAGLGAIWWLAGRHRRGSRAGVLVPISIGVAVVMAFLVLAPNSIVTHELERSVAETQQKNSTLAWRVDSWTSLVRDWARSGPLVWPAGKPFGTGMKRYIESQGQEVTVSAHSHYVSLLVRGGLIVLIAYVAAQVITVRRLLTRRVEAPPWLGAELLAVFMLVNMVYALAYGPDYMQALFMGIGYALAARAVPGAAAVPALVARPLHPPVKRYAPGGVAHLS